MNRGQSPPSCRKPIQPWPSMQAATTQEAEATGLASRQARQALSAREGTQANAVGLQDGAIGVAGIVG
eukprot:12690529-Alexandrium_andersonii.AAC.1